MYTISLLAGGPTSGRALLHGESDRDLPTILALLNLAWIVESGLVSAELQAPRPEDCEAELEFAEILAGLSSPSCEPLEPDELLLFVISDDDEDGFELVIALTEDPRRSLSEYLAAATEIGKFAAACYLAEALMLGARVLAASAYAAACGWGIHSETLVG